MVQHVREGMRVAWLGLRWLHRHTRGCLLLLLALGAATSTSTSATAASAACASAAAATSAAAAAAATTTTVTVTAPATRRLQRRCCGQCRTDGALKCGDLEPW